MCLLAVKTALHIYINSFIFVVVGPLILMLAVLYPHIIMSAVLDPPMIMSAVLEIKTFQGVKAETTATYGSTKQAAMDPAGIFSIYCIFWNTGLNCLIAFTVLDITIKLHELVSKIGGLVMGLLVQQTFKLLKDAALTVVFIEFEIN